MKEGYPFAQDLSLENSADSYLCLIRHLISAANKYYSSVGHYEQKNQNTTGQIKFSAFTLK